MIASLDPSLPARFIFVVADGTSKLYVVLEAVPVIVTVLLEEVMPIPPAPTKFTISSPDKSPPPVFPRTKGTVPAGEVSVDVIA